MLYATAQKPHRQSANGVYCIAHFDSFRRPAQAAEIVGGAQAKIDSETALSGYVSLIVCFAGLPDKIAIAVDIQMDDGLPTTGTVRGQLQSGPSPDIATTAVAAYAETGSNTCTLCRPV